MNLLKSTFPTGVVEKEEKKPDPKAEYERKAIESIGGSMVFVERKRLYWDGKEDTPDRDGLAQGDNT